MWATKVGFVELPVDREDRQKTPEMPPMTNSEMKPAQNSGGS
jgi:hypothetical protein